MQHLLRVFTLLAVSVMSSRVAPSSLLSREFATALRAAGVDDYHPAITHTNACQQCHAEEGTTHVEHCCYYQCICKDYSYTNYTDNASCDDPALGECVQCS